MCTVCLHVHGFLDNHIIVASLHISMYQHVLSMDLGGKLSHKLRLRHFGTDWTWTLMTNSPMPKDLAVMVCTSITTTSNQTACSWQSCQVLLVASNVTCVQALHASTVSQGLLLHLHPPCARCQQSQSTTLSRHCCIW